MNSLLKNLPNFKDYNLRKNNNKWGFKDKKNTIY